MDNPILLKSTTRHIRIFAAEINQEELVPSNQVLTLDVDPDNEFNWSEDALQKVYRKFDEIVESSEGVDLTDYNLRRIGSDLEHFSDRCYKKVRLATILLLASPTTAWDYPKLQRMTIHEIKICFHSWLMS